MEVVEANLDLAPLLASYAKECLESGIPKYLGVEQDPTAYLSGLVERSKVISELPKGYLPSTTYYCVSNSEILVDVASFTLPLSSFFNALYKRMIFERVPPSVSNTKMYISHIY